MQTVLIVAPQFPPSNLAAVHRTRLFARHLPDFGWKPIILTVEPKAYEETLDENLMEFVPDDLHIERVGALPTEPVRLVGDIGVRSFIPMLRRIVSLNRRADIDFLYIPIPPHYSALLGRIAHAVCGLPYGIDYIDPWTQPQWHPEEAFFNRHWVARKLAPFLESVAVRDASLITGVARGYFEDVLDRNPHLHEQAVTTAMPYGGEPEDHRAVETMDVAPCLFSNDDETFHFVYAGALLPKAMEPLEQVFQAIHSNPDVFADVRFHFIGTGTSPDDPEGYKVRPVAERYGLWRTVVDEHPARIPYLDALVHQEAADAVFVLGSTEPHYTPSKVYQGVLAEKPVFAVLHEASTACEVVRSTNAGQVLDFAGATDLASIKTSFASYMTAFRHFADSFAPEQVDQTAFETYSARSVTQTLAESLSHALQRTAAK